MSFYIKTYSSLIDETFKNNKIFLDSNGEIDINLIQKEPNLETVNKFNQIEKFLFFIFYKNKYNKEWKKLLKEIKKNKEFISIIKYIIKLVDNLLKNLQLNKTSELINITLSNEQFGGVGKLTRPKMIFGASFMISSFVFPISLSSSLLIALGITAYDFINSPISSQVEDDAQLAREIGDAYQLDFNREQQIRRDRELSRRVREDEEMARRLQAQEGQQVREDEEMARRLQAQEGQQVRGDRDRDRYRGRDLIISNRRAIFNQYIRSLNEDFMSVGYYGGGADSPMINYIFNLKMYIHSDQGSFHNDEQINNGLVDYPHVNFAAHLLHTGGHFLIILPIRMRQIINKDNYYDFFRRMWRQNINIGVKLRNRVRWSSIIEEILKLNIDHSNMEWYNQTFNEDGNVIILDAYSVETLGPTPSNFLRNPGFSDNGRQFNLIPVPRRGFLLNVMGDGACYFRAIITAIRYNLTGDILGYNPPGILNVVGQIKSLMIDEISD